MKHAPGIALARAEGCPLSGKSGSQGAPQGYLATPNERALSVPKAPNIDPSSNIARYIARRSDQTDAIALQASNLQDTPYLLCPSAAMQFPPYSLHLPHWMSLRACE
ncbi:hypothetical protein VDGL01_02289 [Verticillium dahliae]